MIRKWIMTLGVLCIAGTASAVMTGWTKLTSYDAPRKDLWEWASNDISYWPNSGVEAYNGQTDFAMRITFSGVVLSGTASASDLWTLKSGPQIFGFSAENSELSPFGKWQPETNGGAAFDIGTTKTINLAGISDFSLTFVYDWESKTLGYYFQEAGGESQLLAEMQGLKIDAWVTLKLENMDDLMTAGSCRIDYTNNIGLLPEPTVLALLAVGVAGLTLRRKIS